MVVATANPALSLEVADSSAVDAYPLVEMGRDIATMWCDACHIIHDGDDDEGFDGAPPFPSLAPLVKANPDYYIAFLTNPHTRAMEAITISRDGIDALVAYIGSLDTAE
jgi:mono/diheme cytochrome c family protein